MTARHEPVACGLHDELQLLVLRGRAEWLVLDGGGEIRLDRLTEVDGRPFTGRC